jgi:glycosyltransferase involved in cell wall biosynthesis
LSAVEARDLDVVVCTKNRAEMLERVLKQIIREIPFRNLIVVYSSSSDGTREIARKYAKKVFWDGDKGLGAARKLGISTATSELVAMIDTDVVLARDWHKQLKKHFRDPRVAAAMGTTIYGYGCIPIQRLFEYSRWTDPTAWNCTNTIFRRSSVLKVGNFDETISGAGEDYDLYKRLLAAGYKWICNKKVVVYHPMSLPEYLNHLAWWNECAPFIHELIVQVRNYSLFRIYCRFAYSTLKSFQEGVRLSKVVHPTMLFYVPFFEAVANRTRIKGMKKMLRS